MEKLLTAKEVADNLHVTVNTIYQWVTRREIPFVKLPGNTTRFRETEVGTWLGKRASKGKGVLKGVYLEDHDLPLAA